MGQFRYVPSDEVAQRHRARNAETLSHQAPPKSPKQLNVEAVLSLGDVRYISYRTRVFCIPPVPFKLGQRVLDSQTKMLSHAKHVVTATEGQQDSVKAFYTQMAKHARLLWTHMRPIGKFKRTLWHLHLTRNPLLSASEAELKAVTDFFLQGRMTSSVRSTSATGM